MARGMRWWAGLSLAACVAVAGVYLPPHGTPLGRVRFRELPPATPYRLREQGLAGRWRAAALELALLEARDRLRPELEHRRAHDLPGPGILFGGPDSLPAPARRQIAAELDTIWDRLGIGVPKVSVGVVIQAGRTAGRADRPSLNYRSAYLLPDTSDRRTCLVLMTLPTTWSVGRLLIDGRPAPRETLRPLLQNGLGPCAFYAAFGTPGRPVAAWLASRNFDLALYPWWDRPPALFAELGSENLDPRRNPWFWMNVYQFPTSGVACLGGRPAACRSAVVRGSGSPAPPDHMITTQYWWREQALPGGDRYLSDVVRDIGRDRFRRFWNSELPADSALTAALREPVGEWTQAWASRIVPVLPLGPVARLRDAVLGVLCAVVFVGLVAGTVRRREVR